MRNVSAEVSAVLSEFPAARMHDDTMRYLNEALQAAGHGDAFTILPRIQSALTRIFSALRSFHACKPVSLETYFARGIVPLTREWLVREAHALFEGSIPLAEIQAAGARADLSIRQGMIWFATDPDELTGLSGHYLVYGPESMNCLWADDGRRFHESQDRQRRRGIPTLFECAVPLSFLNREARRDLTKTIVTEYFRGRSRIPDPDGSNTDWGFSIRRSLPPECIIGHTHPTVIYDPLRHGINFHNPVTRCSWCPDRS